MTELERMKKVAKLRELFPNITVTPRIQHVYGVTLARMNFAVEIDITDSAFMRQACRSSLNELVYLINQVLKDMPEKKGEGTDD